MPATPFDWLLYRAQDGLTPDLLTLSSGCREGGASLGRVSADMQNQPSTLSEVFRRPFHSRTSMSVGVFL